LVVLAGRTALIDDELDAFAETELTGISRYATKLHEASLQTANTETLRVRDGLLREAEKTIDLLHRLSLAIRKASSRKSVARLPKLFGHDDGYTWLWTADGVSSRSAIFEPPAVFDATAIFEDFVGRVLRQRWCIADETETLDDAMRCYREHMLRRCIAAISARRRQLTYFQRHHRKLATSQEATVTHTGRTPNSRPIQTSSNLLVPHPHNPTFETSRLEERRQPFSMTISDTVPSDFNVALFRVPPSTSTPSSAGTGSSAGGFGLSGPFEVPPPPELDHAEKEKICPYCCIVYPAKTFSTSRNSRRWRKHLLEDLQPYICLFQNCDQAGTTYRTFKAWQAHLNKAHVQRWVCPMSHEGPNSMKPEDTGFDTAEMFQEHVEVAHRERDSDTTGQREMDPVELHALMQAASERAVLPRWCFVCLTDQSRDTLQQHLAKHLETAFILSLPPRDDIVESSELSSGRLSGGSGRSKGQLSDDVAISNVQDLFPENEDVSREARGGQSLSATGLKVHLAAYNTDRNPSKDMARFFEQLTPENRDSHSTGKYDWQWKYALAYAVLVSQDSLNLRRTATKSGPVCFAAYRFLLGKKGNFWTKNSVPTHSRDPKLRARKDLTRCFLAYAILQSWSTQAGSWALRRSEFSWSNETTIVNRSFRGPTKQPLSNPPAYDVVLDFLLADAWNPMLVQSSHSTAATLSPSRQDGARKSWTTSYGQLQERNQAVLFSGYAFVSLLFSVRSARPAMIDSFLPADLERDRTMRRRDVRTRWRALAKHITQRKRQIRVRHRWRILITAVRSLLLLYKPKSQHTTFDEVRSSDAPASNCNSLERAFTAESSLGCFLGVSAAHCHIDNSCCHGQKRACGDFPSASPYQLDLWSSSGDLQQYPPTDDGKPLQETRPTSRVVDQGRFDLLERMWLSQPPQETRPTVPAVDQSRLNLLEKMKQQLLDADERSSGGAASYNAQQSAIHSRPLDTVNAHDQPIGGLPKPPLKPPVEPRVPRPFDRADEDEPWAAEFRKHWETHGGSLGDENEERAIT
jgi:hypothetical protein